jgi:HPt (histidine-containing phosphotransfer) domain-containing protein
MKEPGDAMADTIGIAENGTVYIDLEEGLKRVVNNAKLYVKLLVKFKTDADLEGIFDSLQGGNYENAQVKAHTLKGIAANLSFKELFKQTLELETQIKQKAVDPALPGAVRQCFNETVQYVDKVIAHYG